MPTRKYPDKIELKVENRVKRGDDNAFNTEDQQKAAGQLKEHWPINFTELEDMYQYTDGMYRRVINRYFGPSDSPKTFNEVWEEYGTIDQYHKRRGEEENSSDAYERGYDKGFKAGYEKGYEQAKKQYSDE